MTSYFGLTEDQYYMAKIRAYGRELLVEINTERAHMGLEPLLDMQEQLALWREELDRERDRRSVPVPASEPHVWVTVPQRAEDEDTEDPDILMQQLREDYYRRQAAKALAEEPANGRVPLVVDCPDGTRRRVDWWRMPVEE
jgi:hypothetical protein